MHISVRDFLLLFKAVAGASGVDIVPRHDTMATLAHLGLTKRNLKDILLSLSVADFSEGPLEDEKGGDLWVFGKEVKGMEIYIKLKVAEVGGERIAKCISFHIPKHPLSYPLKGSP